MGVFAAAGIPHVDMGVFSRDSHTAATSSAIAGIIFAERCILYAQSEWQPASQPATNLGKGDCYLAIVLRGIDLLIMGGRCW